MKPEKKMAKEIPHIFVILFFVIVAATIATYIIPAGQYARVLDETIGKTVIDPSSFKYIPNTPVGPFAMFVAIELGLIEAANITFMIFAAFSCLYLMEKTGAIDASIAMMVNKTRRHPKYATAIIVILMIILSVWGSTGTLSYEEIIAFTPIFVALSIALGYDALVGVAISVIPVGVGFASATVNPFTIGVAQTIAELPLFSGLGYRCVILAVMTAYTILYVLWYARRIKKDPSKSLVSNVDYSDFTFDEERLSTPFTLERKLSMLVLCIGVAAMGYGLIFLKWYINQVAAIFIIVSIVVGIINHWSANKIADTLCEGLSRGVLAAMIVGIARGILVVISQGNILDTIIHACVKFLEQLSLHVSAIGMLFFQNLLNFIVPSGSGQASVSMPFIIPIADLIDKEDIAVSMTHGGYIKRIPVSEYRSQRRGGMGVTAHKAKEDDFVEHIFVSNTHQDLMFFTNLGKVFTMKGYEIPEASKTSRGRAIINLLQLVPGEKVQTVLPLPEEREGRFLMLATRNGLIKKTPLSEFESIKRNGKIAIKFVDDDELIEAVLTGGNDELIMASDEGYCIHFNEKDIRPTGRTAMGVKSMRLAEGAHMVDLAVVTDDCEILTVTSHGYGKRSSIADYPLQGRAGKGVKAGVFNEKTGGLAGLKVIPADTDIMMITDGGIIIRVQADEISKIGRATQGVRIMKLKDDSAKVVSIALTPHEEEEPEVVETEGAETVETTETPAETATGETPAEE